MKPLRLGDILQELGYINAEQITAALAYQKEHRDLRLGQALQKLGFVNERQVLEALGRRLNLRIVDFSELTVDVSAVEKIPHEIAQKYDMLPIAQSGRTLTVAANDPLNYYAIEDIRQLTGMEPEIVLAELEPLRRAIRYYSAEVSARKAASRANSSDMAAMRTEDLAIDIRATGGDTEAPIIRLLNSLVQRAVTTGASDIHIEPFEKETKVRMRIDGVIIDYVTLQPALHQPLIARIKIMSNLDIAEHRVPQDGHFRARLDTGSDINVRVSILPTVFGEKAVLRILSGSTRIEHADHFGMDDETYQRFLPLLDRPNGIVYLTGPTGSGKTTTLYMVLQAMADRQVNISTVEDPVERNLPRINQTQVNPLAGLTFEAGLRALLRQDPDIIMVGETRDAETASISVRAAPRHHRSYGVFDPAHQRCAFQRGSLGGYGCRALYDRQLGGGACGAAPDAPRLPAVRQDHTHHRDGARPAGCRQHHRAPRHRLPQLQRYRLQGARCHPRAGGHQQGDAPPDLCRGDPGGADPDRPPHPRYAQPA